MNAAAPELIADYACQIGENPLWHPLERKLYWCDIPVGRIFSYNSATRSHGQIYSGRTVGGFCFQAEGGLLLFQDRGTIARWRDDVYTELLAEIPAERNSRFNDVIADPAGRVFCGTMSTPENKGRLYRLDVDGSLHLVLEGIGCSNGMAFTQDHKSFFYTDSFAHEIYRFDYNEADGSITNPRVFVRFAEADGLPDGMTLDCKGHLWTALWDGGCIVRLAEDGNIVEKFSIPAPKTSSLTFGGDDLDQIYVTTAGGDQRHVDGEFAGALFRIFPGVRGVPEYFSRIAGSKIVLA